MKGRTKDIQHRWGERDVVDAHHTNYPCVRCGLLRVTRHERGQRSWQEFWRDGVVVALAHEPRPICDARLLKAAADAAAIKESA